MKRFNLLLAGLALPLLLLSGCGKNGSDSASASANNNLEPIKVQLEVAPQEIQTGEKVKFTAKVTYQGEEVDDAKEVMFEFWKDGDSEDDHSMESVQSAGEGNYVLEATFDDPGTYHVISHVTAKDQHSMPSAEFTVIE
ncbi:FixH family protein [Paenibacillus sp. M1]|uniref:FixH family protein n=1 Tax=Paenibacillus haidiansis TaxID=1574488 RepID=A0ABU7VVJ4_9BACL